MSTLAYRSRDTGLGAQAFVPDHLSFPVMRTALQTCRGCELYKYATQAVAGEGPARSSIVFIGEQPGDEEDRRGHPFVGPAGRLLDRALEEAGIDRSKVLVTNAVKHFKFEERGKRRLHKKPDAAETRACRPWLAAEMELLRPDILVCLGATAALSVFGPHHRVTKDRGQFVEHQWAKLATSTIHPSAILRALPKQREIEYGLFVADLRKIQVRAKAELLS